MTVEDGREGRDFCDRARCGGADQWWLEGVRRNVSRARVAEKASRGGAPWRLAACPRAPQAPTRGLRRSTRSARAPARPVSPPQVPPSHTRARLRLACCRCSCRERAAARRRVRGAGSPWTAEFRCPPPRPTRHAVRTRDVPRARIDPPREAAPATTDRPAWRKTKLAD